jgi:glycosyltransferase involved in cell wall biosynthesis
MKTAILLPTHNEEKGLEKCLDALNAKIAAEKRKEWEVWVIDSCSTDRTMEIAKEKGAKTLQLPIRGKGIAMKKAFADLDVDAIVMIDSDMTYPIESIPEIEAKLAAGYDVVIGSRFGGKIEEGAMSTRNKIGNTCISLAASILYLHRTTDVCSGMWGFSRKTYKMLAERITAPHLELECDMYAECVKRGMKVTEIPIDYARREGETKLDALKYGVLDILQLLKKRI